MLAYIAEKLVYGFAEALCSLLNAGSEREGIWSPPVHTDV